MYRILTLSAFAGAIILRLFLCWANPPGNSFDNHFEPIVLIAQTGHIPAKEACFQCYNPPVFYVVSALAAMALETIGLNVDVIIKSLQFLGCLYGILTLLILYLILRRIQLAEFSRFIAFAVVCFLPRHMYMSAMHSNDSLSYMTVALSVYLFLVAVDRKFPWPFAATLGGTVAISLFVKYTAFIVLPMAAIPLFVLLVRRTEIPRSRVAMAIGAAIIVPSMLLGGYMAHNHRAYGKALPWNDGMIDISVNHPRDPEVVSFLSFTPWQYIDEPIVIPGHMHSFWTMIYCGMWIDIEPKFTYFTDRNAKWWPWYYAWLRGESSFPPLPTPISRFTRVIAAGLIVIGLVPLGLFMAGLVLCIRFLARSVRQRMDSESIKLLAFPALVMANAAGVMLLVMKAPVYSAMKATYFLGSMPALCVLVALGVQMAEGNKRVRIVIAAGVAMLVVLASLNVAHIVLALLYAPDNR